MKAPLLSLLLLCCSLPGCNALDNQAEYNRVDCGDVVSDDHFYVVDSQKIRVPFEDFQILIRSGSSQSVKSAAPTSKGCFSANVLRDDDTILVKSPGRNEAQVVRPEMINGRTMVVLQPLADVKPKIVCNHNMLDTTLVLNQFVDFNDARFLEFYNIAAAISLDRNLVDKTDMRPLLNAGTYDLKHLVRGRMYDVDLQIQDYVFSNGSLLSTPCELDMDIPNLSAKLGDEIKEFRSYFGDSYGVVDQGYQLNFYIEGGLKSVEIDYCVTRVSPEQNLQVNPETGCADLGLPVRSYASSEKIERFDNGFWLVLYRYKKGLLTKPWMAQKLMVRKVCDAGLVRYEDLDKNYCTDISGNIRIAGRGLSGTFELKYASAIIGQLSILDTNYQAIRLPNLEFASQLLVQGAIYLEALEMPLLKQVSIDLTVSDNYLLKDLRGLASLERVGNNFTVSTLSSIVDLEGLEKLKVVGGDMSISSNEKLMSLGKLESLTTIGGSLSLFSNNGMKVADPIKNLEYIGTGLTVQWNNQLETLNLAPSEINGGLGFIENPKLATITGLERNETVQVLNLNGNEKLANLDAFAHIKALPNGLQLEKSPLIRNFKGLRSLRTMGSLRVNSMANLESFAGLEAVKGIGSLEITRNSSLYDLRGLDGVEKLQYLTIRLNENLQSLLGLKSLTSVDDSITIQENATMRSLAGTALSSSKLRFVTIESNNYLQDVAILSSLGSAETVSIQYNWSLLSLKELKNLKSVMHNLTLVANPKVESLEGLSSLETVGGDFAIENHHAKSLAGLGSLTTVGGNLSFTTLDISDMSGLTALISVKKQIILRSNSNLTSLDGLKGLDSVGEGFLFASSNLKNPCVVFENPAKVNCKSN